MKTMMTMKCQTQLYQYVFDVRFCGRGQNHIEENIHLFYMVGESVQERQQHGDHCFAIFAGHCFSESMRP